MASLIANALRSDRLIGFKIINFNREIIILLESLILAIVSIIKP
jgi:hypothetical protein